MESKAESQRAEPARNVAETGNNCLAAQEESGDRHPESDHEVAYEMKVAVATAVAAVAKKTTPKAYAVVLPVSPHDLSDSFPAGKAFINSVSDKAGCGAVLVLSATGKNLAWEGMVLSTLKPPAIGRVWANASGVSPTAAVSVDLPHKGKRQKGRWAARRRAIKSCTFQWFRSSESLPGTAFDRVLAGGSLVQPMRSAGVSLADADVNLRKLLIDTNSTLLPRSARTRPTRAAEPSSPKLCENCGDVVPDRARNAKYCPKCGTPAKRVAFIRAQKKAAATATSAQAIENDTPAQPDADAEPVSEAPVPEK